MRRTGRASFLVVGLLVGLAIAMPAPAVGAEELVVYSGRGERFTRPVVKAFEKNSGIKVQSLVANAGSLLARIQEEGSRTPASVFISNSAPVLERARAAGLLQPHSSAAVKKIPSKYRGPGDAWVGGSARARAIVYNPKLVKPGQILSTLDLAQPAWKGKLGLTVSTNGSFVAGLASLVGRHGTGKVRGFLEGMKANAGNNVFPKHTPIVSAVARGEIALGWINHYYYYRAIEKNPKADLGIIFPDQDSGGAPMSLSGLAVLKHAKNVAAARRFVDFVLSPEGQRIYAGVNFEFPVNGAVPIHPLLPQGKKIVLAHLAPALDPEGVNRAVDLIKSVGMQ